MEDQKNKFVVCPERDCNGLETCMHKQLHIRDKSACDKTEQIGDNGEDLSCPACVSLSVYQEKLKIQDKYIKTLL